jgi:streptogramin lyase
MPDLNSRFRGAEGIPTPHLWQEIISREPKALPESSPVRRLLVVAFALAVAFAALVFVVQAFAGGESQPASEPVPTPSGPTSTPTAVVADRIDVGGGATSVAYGAGSIWVSISPANSGDRAVVRIDPQTGEILATIPTPVVPSWTIGGGGLLVAQGSVWVAGVDASSKEIQGGVVRIDPTTNGVADRITFKEGRVADVAVDASGIWALISGNPGKPEVLRIDPASNQIVASIPLEGGYGRHIFAIGGSVFAALAQPPGGDFDGGTLVRIDPSSNGVASTFDLRTYPSVASGDGSIWAITHRGLVQIDLTTGQPIGEPARVPCTGDALAVGAGGVWCFGADRDRALGRFNPQTTLVDVAMKPNERTGGIALGTSPGSVWVVDGAQLTRVDLVTGGGERI